VLQRCLAVKPGARCASWAEVEDALAEAYSAVTGAEAPGAEAAAALSRAERVAAGWSYSAMGLSYLDISKAEVALGYFERSWAAGRAEGERWLEAAGLNNLGLAYADLGDARRAIGYYEQASTILEEIGDVMGSVSVGFNLALLLAQQGRLTEALPHAERAAQVFTQIGHAGYAQRAQQLVAQIRAVLRQPL
jgi:tetratricopeptide (TPR) repeat protein